MKAKQHPRLSFRPLLAALVSVGVVSGPALAAPQGGTVRAGSASIAQSGSQTLITQATDRAVIDWRSFSVAAPEAVKFQQPTSQSATLNRVTGDQVSLILGRIDANGQVALVNPNGIVIGAGAQINVGSLIASTANITDANFMAGRMVFDQPGLPGAGVANQGQISAAEGGLVALVAPTVRNDGVIQARLGKVVLGGGDTFTLDLYGDNLVKLALPQDMAATLTGQIEQAGRIEADGGQIVLVSVARAKAVVDQAINLSGVLRADQVAQQAGRILLLAEGGAVSVSGDLSAQGGRIDVLGQAIQVASGARLDAGGGTLHVGGGWQGGDGYRASNVVVEEGARLLANGGDTGNGGEVVVWSDGATVFAGSIEARGGRISGDGGRVEVSGKGTLDFSGFVDASVSAGQAGSLLLDPAFLTIGLAEAGTINRVLRTGTSTALQADVDITLNAMIDGRGGIAGGGLTMTAGNNVNLNEHVVTNAGAINITATSGSVNMAAGKGLYSLGADIQVQGGGGVSVGDVVAGGGLISITSANGDIALNGDLATSGATAILVDADNGSISMAAGKGAYTGSGNITLAAGTTATATQLTAGVISTVGGTVSLTSGTGGMVLSDYVASGNGNVTASSGGALTTAAGKGIFAGSGSITLTGASISAGGALASTGSTSLTATAGNVVLDTVIGSSNGNLTLNATGAVDINGVILNGASGASLSVTAGNGISVDAQIDGRGGATGGTVTLNATGGNIALNESIITNAGTLGLSAGNGSVTTAAGKGLYSGGSAINVSGRNGVTAGDVVAGGSNIALTSSNGNISVAGDVVTSGAATININAAAGSVSLAADKGLYTDIGAVTLTAGTTGSATSLSAGLISTGGNVTITSGTGGAALNGDIHSGGNVGVTSGGAITTAAGKGIYANAGNVTLTGNGGVQAGIVDASGTLAVTASAGAITLDGKVDADDGVTLSADGNININEAVTTISNDISVTSANGGIGTTSLTPASTGFYVADGAGGIGTGAITLNARNDVSTQVLSTQGTVSVTSTAGNITLNQMAGTSNTGLTFNANQTLDLGGNRLVSLGTIDLTAGNSLSLPDVAGTARDIEGTHITITSGGAITGAGLGATMAATATDGLGNRIGTVTLTANGGGIDNISVYNTPSVTLSARDDIGTSVFLSGTGSDLDPVTVASHAQLTSTQGSVNVRTAGFDQVTVTANQDIILDSLFTRLGTTGTLNAGRDIVFYAARGSQVTATAGRDILLPWEVDGDGNPLPVPTPDSPVNVKVLFDDATLIANRHVAIDRGLIINNSLSVTAQTGNITSSLRGVTLVNSFSTGATPSASYVATQGNVNLGGPLQVFGPLSISAPLGTVTLGDVTEVTGAITLSGGSAVRLDGKTTLTAGSGVGDALSVTAPSIYLGGQVFTNGHAMNYNGNLLVSPSAYAASLSSHGGTYTDANADGTPDFNPSCPGNCTPITTTTKQVRINAGGAPITVTGTTSLDPAYNGFATLLLEAPGSTITLNGNLSGVTPGVSQSTRGLEFGAYATTLTLGGGVTLTPNVAYFYHTGGVFPPGCSGVCALKPAGWYGVGSAGLTGAAHVVNYAGTYTLLGQSVTQLGYTNLTLEWVDPAEPYSAVVLSGNGTPVPPGPSYPLTLVTNPFLVTLSNPGPFTGAPSPTSVLFAPPLAISEVAVTAPVLSPSSPGGSVSGPGSLTSLAGVPGTGSDGALAGEDTSTTQTATQSTVGTAEGTVIVAALAEGSAELDEIVLESGRGPAQEADLGRGGSSVADPFEDAEQKKNDCAKGDQRQGCRK